MAEAKRPEWIELDQEIEEDGFRKSFDGWGEPAGLYAKAKELARYAKEGEFKKGWFRWQFVRPDKNGMAVVQITQQEMDGDLERYGKLIEEIESVEKQNGSDDYFTPIFELVAEDGERELEMRLVNCTPLSEGFRFWLNYSEEYAEKARMTVYTKGFE